jgi:hypothetical protein
MTRNIAKRLAASTVLAGCAVISSSPAYGAVAPEPEPPGVAGQPSQVVIDHYLADTTGANGSTSTGHQGRTFPISGEQPNKAMIEHAERSAAADSSVPGVLSAQTKAQVEHLERSSSGGSSSVAGVLSAQARAQAAYLEQLAAQQEAASTSAATGSSSSDDDVSAPLVVLALLGGGLIVGAASTYTLRRIRHSGPVSTATA